MDSKASGVTASSRRQLKQILPRQTDLIVDALSLMADMQPGEQLAFFVCDAEDAYWQMPLHPAERRFYCSRLRMLDGTERYLAYVRTPQGSVGAPLSWSQEFGLISRCVSSVLRCPVVPGAHRKHCLLYTSPSPRDATLSRMPSSA